MEFLPANPETLRLAVFLSAFTLLALLENIWPRRPPTVSKPQRWLVNLILVAANTLLMRLVFPLAPFALAALAQSKGWGLFNLLKVSGPLETGASLLLLDFLIYSQHRLFHRTPLLWRMHRMHHTDLDLDVTSGTRFHPLEIFLSLAIKLSAVLVIGTSPLAVLLFEMVLNATSMFSHANLRLPLAMDRWLRFFLVTPDMHRVHHSVIPQETNRNFGFNLSWWDRLLGTYQAQPRDGHDGMLIGLQAWRDQRALGLWQVLIIPFLHSATRSKP
jgi:sterol desaturase/sphingolipid hydroxylase (fatty acid hydroxylase superfamily)